LKNFKSHLPAVSRLKHLQQQLDEFSDHKNNLFQWWEIDYRGSSENSQNDSGIRANGNQTAQHQWKPSFWSHITLSYYGRPMDL